jgi:hypothetical protein
MVPLSLTNKFVLNLVKPVAIILMYTNQMQQMYGNIALIFFKTSRKITNDNTASPLKRQFAVNHTIREIQIPAC